MFITISVNKLPLIEANFAFIQIILYLKSLFNPIYPTICLYLNSYCSDCSSDSDKFYYFVNNKVRPMIFDAKRWYEFGQDTKERFIRQWMIKASYLDKKVCFFYLNIIYLLFEKCG